MTLSLCICVCVCVCPLFNPIYVAPVGCVAGDPRMRKGVGGGAMWIRETFNIDELSCIQRAFTGYGLAAVHFC